MDTKHYTNERNVQIIISLLKAYGIRRVIASPGTTNMTFVGSIQNDPWFEIFSSVDERSAAYMACGLAAETGEPVAISCTGATASRNYMPGLTEAYYRKLPVLAITSHRGDFAIGHLYDQQIDRRTIPNDIAVCSVTVPLVKDASDARYCFNEATKAILSLTHRGGGPAHINLYTSYSTDFSVKELPKVTKVERYTAFDGLPALPEGKKVAVFIGSHKPFTERETEAIDDFCAAHDAVVFCDHTSGYRGKFETHFSIFFTQDNYRSSLLSADLLIHIGEVSGDLARMKIGEVWRVGEDGEFRNTFGCLKNIFEMPEEYFFKAYTPEDFTPCSSFHDACRNELKSAFEQLPELPFSNVWIAQQLHRSLPMNSRFFMGIYNSLRSYNFFELPKSVTSSCNVGGFGIDGGISSMIGASLANPDILHIGVFGDLGFFYDLNVCGNRHVGNNVRILLVNNGKGNEFRNYGHYCSVLGEDADKFIAAAGHYGNKSSELVKHYAEDLGYRYIKASGKEEFLQGMQEFVNPAIGTQPIIFEVFTTTEDESDAIKSMRTFMYNGNTALKIKIEKTVRGALGTKGVSLLKKMLGK
ncbi:MAG: 2-succinyl-5-enolpyruvyl-6-hydroxy-3-cyclohexene-1-carboxylate synthase [Bacteroidales bacterium]|nr:2-succinyl-5-enolpyruvyl-6-hydroxy-3-cyclohexene-1-carboxylate synthase [Candidatus Cacconaster merdequi]